MKSRRYFLIQTTLATTAMVALKPFQSFGSTFLQLTGFSRSYSKLAFLHTANLKSNRYNEVSGYIQNIKNKNANTILLDAGQNMHNEQGSLMYDASINKNNDLSSIASEYKIITKGNTRTGIINAKVGESNIVQKIKALSTLLKKEKKCAIVVCLSQLGYKNENAPDDLTLAKESTDLDIIIGGHAENFHMQPVVALNRNKAEVIIHSASANSFDYGKIEIGFDWQGEKNQISIASHSSKSIISNQVISAA